MWLGAGLPYQNGFSCGIPAACCQYRPERRSGSTRYCFGAPNIPCSMQVYAPASMEQEHELTTTRGGLNVGTSAGKASYSPPYVLGLHAQ